ncbi:MAG: hypothetical protein NWF01_04840 [Candidatus Bathyarchaeota archaeon]|nr:hypothetical protein [Candidatus Bathyarchaeota archaeon]
MEKQLPASGCSNIIQTSDGGFLIIGTQNRGFTIKTDASGNVEWSQTYSFLWVQCALQNNDGGYTIAGYNRTRFFLIKLDSQGSMLWKQEYNFDQKEKYYIESASLTCLLQTKDGGYLLAGSGYYYHLSHVLLVKTDSQGQLQWNKTNDCDYLTSIIQTSNDEYVVFGGDSLDPPWYTRFCCVEKLDSEGNFVWKKDCSIPKASRTDINTVVSCSDGYILAGATAQDSPSIAWACKTDFNGKMIWNKTYSNLGNGVLIDSIFKANAGFVFFAQPSQEANQTIIVQIDQNGEVQNQKIIDNKNFDTSQMIQTGKDTFYSVSEDGMIIRIS